MLDKGKQQMLEFETKDLSDNFIFLRSLKIRKNIAVYLSEVFDAG